MRSTIYILIVYISSIFISSLIHADKYEIEDKKLLAFFIKYYPSIIDRDADDIYTEKAALVTGMVDCSGLGITNLDGIQFFTKITGLNASNNNLTSIPNISNLSLLNILDVSNNKITQLPDLSKNIALNKIITTGNLLESIVGINQLQNLTILDISKNRIKYLPELTNCMKIKYLIFNDNDISVINGLPNGDSLKLFKLNNNKLTFEQLSKTLKLNNFRNVVDASNQNPENWILEQYVNEFDTITLASSIDFNTPGVKYNWVKNYNTINYLNSPVFSKYNCSKIDSGYYCCYITHDSFPNISIHSNTIRVKIKNCFKPDNITYKIRHQTCDSLGGIQIGGIYEYKVNCQIKHHVLGITDTTSNGTFNTLVSGTYDLKVDVANGCSKEIPDAVFINNEPCDFPIISPNDDGKDDLFYIDDTGHADIFNKQGRKIKTMTLPGVWDGSTASGRVNPGLYIININEGSKIIRISVIY